MSRWRRAFDRIGGPDAVTWPAFWITFAAGILGHFTAGGEVTAPMWVRIVVVALAQVAMFAPLVLLRFTVLRDPPTPRPWVAVSGFLVAAVVRGIALTALLLATGAVEEPLWAYRIASAIQVHAVLLLIIALVVGTMHAYTRSLQELLSLQSDLEQARARIVSEVTERNDDVIAKVRDRLRREFTALDSAQGADSVAELQRLASDVVRPMSHDLASPLPLREIAPSAVADEHVTWQQAVAQMIDRAPLRPVLAALLMGLFMVTATIGIFGIRGVVLTMSIVASVLIWSALANLLLRLVMPRLVAGAALLVVVLMALAIGLLSAGAGAWAIRSVVSPAIFTVCGGVFIAGIVMLLALVSAVIRRQHEAERALIVHTELLRREVVRLRQAQWLQQKALSRALHGPVQSAVTAAALRLDAAVRSSASTEALVTEIRQELRSMVDLLDVAEAEAPSLDTAFARISATWEGICTVTTAVSPVAGYACASDPLAAACVVDILTEAVSNAVRHGGATCVQITLTAADSTLDVVVSDDGETDKDTPASSGLGTSLLDECTMSWSRASSPSGHVLGATIPTHSPDDDLRLVHPQRYM